MSKLTTFISTKGSDLECCIVDCVVFVNSDACDKNYPALLYQENCIENSICNYM